MKKYTPALKPTLKSMFPSLNESIGWQRGIDSILPNSTILLGESNPIDTLPFIYSFMNFWLKPQTTITNSAIIFVAFKFSQNRINSIFRKLYGIQLNLLAAQSKFSFIDAVNGSSDQILEGIVDALKRTEKSRTLVILEGFSWTIANGSAANFINLFSKIQTLSSSYNTNLLIQWSRDLEDDYPGRNPVLIEDIRLGGAGWLYLLNNCHYVFCVRPLKSGMTRDASGEIIAAFGPLMQDVQVKPTFHPILTLFRIPTDNSIQCFTKGNL